LRTDHRPTDDPPTDDRPLIWITSNGHISARDHPIYFMFGSRAGYSRSADQMTLFPVWWDPSWRLGRHLGKFKSRYLRNGSSNLLHVWC